MEGLKAWAREIVAIIVFGGFFELLIPAGAMRRYARLAVGLLLLLTVLGPVLGLAQDPRRWAAAVSASATPNVSRTDDRVAAVRAQVERHARAIFLARVQEAAAAAAREVPGVADARAQAALPEGGPAPGGLPAVRLSLEVVVRQPARPDDVRGQIRRRVADRLHVPADDVEVSVRRGQERAPSEGGHGR